MAIAPGTRLGHYEIRALQGAGGMGEVYLAQDLTLHRPVALKFLRVALTTKKERLMRFEREAHAVSGLNHPNILTIYEIAHHDGHDFIVTEFIDGEPLRALMERGRLTIPETLDIGSQAASALAAAHAAGVVHRDIKPDNIMVRQDRLVKVLDFGLAKLQDPEGGRQNVADVTQSIQMTKPGLVVGTPGFMSPEQARGLPVDARTDIWSLGVVLYSMVTGKPAFDGETPSDLIAAILTTEPPPLTDSAPDTPPELARIVTTALRKNVDERYQAMQDLALDLKAHKQRLEFEAELERTGAGPAKSPTQLTPATTQPTPIARPALAVVTRPLRRMWLLTAAALVGALAVGYGAYARFWPASGAAGITSLAVLPLKNVSNDPEQDYLSDGITESLINRLSQLPGVKVIANSSSSTYKGKDVSPKDVGKELDVTGVLAGRVSRLGDSLTISVELIDTRDQTLAWGERYVRNAADVLQVQAEVSREIAETLRVRLTAGQQQQLATKETVNPEAYELLLKGRFHRSKGGTDDRTRAAEYFRQAIAIDPRYALAHAELSDIYRSLIGSGTLAPNEYQPKAEEAALESLELDEQLAEGHYALANLRTYAWQWAEAEKSYKRAIELNPNLALARRWYASYLRLMGRHELAIAEIERARALDPLSPGVNATVGYLLFNARRYDDAIASLTRTLELDRTYPYTHLFLGFAYAAKGKHGDAIAAVQQAITLGLDTPSTQIVLGTTYAGAGKRAEAEAILTQLETGRVNVSPGELALLHAALGDTEKALASLETAYEARDLQLQYLGVHPGYDPLRADPRFQDLVKRVGLSN
jgi:serine/threonine-protein kinase